MPASLDKLVAFIAVVDAGGITQAAATLGRSQSSVSRTISALEETWGVRLFIRNGPSLTLTPDGERLVERARRAVAGVESLERFAASITRVEEGELRIAAPSSIASERLAGPVGRFTADHPHVPVTITEATYDTAARLLLSGDVDLAFLDKQIEQEDFVNALLERDELMVVAPRDHFPGAGPVSMKQVLASPFVGDSETVPYLLQKHPHLRVRCITSDITVVLALVEAGAGVSILPKLTLERKSFDIEVRPLETTAFRNIFLARRKRQQLSAAASEFLSYVGVAN